jgi:lincosamide nucleotidyltransferase A/C/D/E
MSGPQVLEVLDVLARGGVEGWLAGGWGIDALVGRETRRHYDADFVIDNARTEYPRVAEVLSLAGFRLRAEYHYPEEPMAVRYEWIHADGHPVIDILPVDFQQEPFGRPSDDLLDSRLDDLFTTGRIGECPVPCLSARLQIALHSGYPPRFKDSKDLELLRALSTLEAPAG